MEWLHPCTSHQPNRHSVALPLRDQVLPALQLRLEIMRYGGGAVLLLAPVLESTHPNCSGSLLGCRSYRDSILSISVSRGLCRSALFLPPVAEIGEGSYCSSTSTASSPASASGSSSSLDDYFSSGSWAAGVHELRAIADQMVHEGYTQDLIRAFGGAAACSSGGPGCPDELLLERWFSELDVDWVLRTGEGGEDGMVQLQLIECVGDLQDLMERWIRALLTMVQVLCITQLELRAKRPAAGGVRKVIRSFQLLFTRGTLEYKQEVAQFARFAEAIVHRMLAFVDAVAVVALNDPQAPEALPGMLQVYACLSEASPTILALFEEASELLRSSGETQSSISSALGAMRGVFFRKRKKLSYVIWSLMEKVKASFLSNECWRVPSPEAAAAGVHETTALMTNYIKLLWRNEGALSFILQDHHFSVFVSEADGFDLVANLVADMISFLENQLVNASKSISNTALRCLFLLNNWHFVSQRVQSLYLPSWTSVDNHKIQRYIDAYLEVSWMPLMSCLYNDMPFGLKRYLSLTKFESGFERTYAEQKLWKVPDPELRRTLRGAIIDIVVSGYSAYAEKRSLLGANTVPRKNTPQELEDLLREMFEG